MKFRLRALMVCGSTIVLTALLTSGSAFAIRAFALTPGWICVPTTAGISAISGGTGAVPSCTAGTTAVEAPTYISSGDAGNPEVNFGTAARFASPVTVAADATFVSPVTADSSVTAASVTSSALNVQGGAAFARSGVVTVSANKVSATVSKVSLDSGSLVLATVQGHPSGIWVTGATKSVSGSTITIFLSKVGRQSHQLSSLGLSLTNRPA